MKRESKDKNADCSIFLFFREKWRKMKTWTFFLARCPFIGSIMVLICDVALKKGASFSLIFLHTRESENDAKKYNIFSPLPKFRGRALQQQPVNVIAK